MIEYSLSEQTEIPPGGDLSVKVIGVGGAGANVLDRMALEGSDEADLLTLNTDVRALSTSVSTNKLQLGSTLLKGMGAGGDPELGRQAALEAIDDIRDSVRGYKMAFVCVGLGGGTGSGAAPEVCRVAKEEGVFLVVFATLPFSFEGKRRMDQALEALDRIGDYANAVVTFENDRMGELIVPKDGVQQAFAAADKIISQSIRATTGVVGHPGIIRIGMDELLSALDTKKSRCLFGFGQAKGDNRAHEALEQALKSPLLDKGKLLQNAKNVLIHVGGGDGMTLFEVELVMQELAKHIDENRTQILFGTGTDKSLGSSLTVTVISSLEGPGGGGDRPAREPKSREEDAGSDPPFTPPKSSSPLAGAVEALESDDASESEMAEVAGSDPEPEPAIQENAPVDDSEVEVEEEAEAVQEEPPAVEEIIEEEIEELKEEEAAVEEISEDEVEALEEEKEEAVVEEILDEEETGVIEEEVVEEAEAIEAEAESEVVSEDRSDEESASVPPLEEAPPPIDAEVEVEPISESENDEAEPAPEVEEPEAEENDPAEPVEPEPKSKKVVQAIPKRNPVIEVPKKGPTKLDIAPIPPKPEPLSPADSGAWSDLESPDSIGKLLQQGKQANEDAEAGAKEEEDVDVDAETVPVEAQPKEPKPKVSIRDLARKSREEVAEKPEPQPEPVAPEPEPVAPKPEPAAPVEEPAEATVEEEEMIVAETEDAQKITLSRLVPGVGGKGPKSKAPAATEPASPESAAPASPVEGGEPLDLSGDEEGLEIDAVTAQQQQMLQLEPLSKGRFAKTEPTIVDGEDMDVPTFLRKRRK